MSLGRSGPARASVRCAIYTRKSTTEGLDSDFNTLDAQREAAEHYVRSQAAQGWTILERRYDDGGFTGGNLERPALQRLLDDVDRGEVDMVVVYKVDRLSRSLLDFARLMERFERRGVGLVSITQAFDTSGSMGRLVLNVLLSFAQFERELISERTRDKVQAARRRGRWTGGHVVLGYGLDPDKRGLKVVEAEAKVVRLLFDLYLKTRSIDAVADQLNALGFTQKRYETRKGVNRGGGAWTRNAVHSALRNPLYVGKVRGRDTLHLGEQRPIVDLDVFEAAAKSLDDRTTGRTRRSRVDDYLLAGILRCGPCAAPMWPSASKGRNGAWYRYYRCSQHQRRAVRCPRGLVGAEQIEAAVVAQVAQVARRDDVRAKVAERLRGEARYAGELKEGRDRLHGQLLERSAEAKRLLGAFAGAAQGGKLLADRLGELEVEIDALRRQVEEHDERLGRLQEVSRRAEEAAAALEAFEAVWEALVPQDRSSLVRLVVQQVTVERGGLRIALYDLPSEASVADPVGATA